VKSEDSLASVLLVSRLASEGLRPLKASEFWDLCDRVGRPSALLGLTEAPLVGEHELEPDLARRIVALLGRATAVAFELDRLDQSGISTLSPFDEGYPARLVERLGPQAPAVLYAAGNLDLLSRPGLGVVGDTTGSSDEVEVAAAAAASGARLGLPVVCGGMRGVGPAAMAAAWEAGGSVVAMVADPLVPVLRSPDVRRAVHRGAAVLCTPYGPDVPFSTANALARNKLVYAQSLVTLVVAAGNEQGDAWSGAVEALDRSPTNTVAVWRGAGEGAGNQALQERGAVGVESVDDLEALLGQQ
jgi:predicted Rossmann fold nucleotide-binding protein DprA/Smf involved in DNA uptake